MGRGCLRLINRTMRLIGTWIYHKPRLWVTRGSIGRGLYLTGEKPVSAELVESVLSRQLDDLEPTLMRHGYRIKDLVEQFDAEPTEINALFHNMLDPARSAELRDRMLAAGLPI